ncbi:Spo0E family sporulation regulatory protein-aspartic acid phosphatase [Ferviditalea candida]|uniref:Aspartyl-phosphate phosphatase Spo0E family protein n=1 Tax=Ferviditalea candida TaxID=3108399 RepID=A0ABU5ZDH1_9BACL|nr:aspartyl-phosphate phosphatase Spo0E family protein [Paenibacillaceae bacterium T2]
MKNLLHLIEDARSQLSDIAFFKSELTDHEVVAVSRQLDALIVEYLKHMNKKTA